MLVGDSAPGGLDRGLRPASLALVVLSQESSEGSAIESTFTRAPERR